jgi:hypothetical protein
VFTAQYALSPYIKQTRFVFKGLISSVCGRSCCVSYMASPSWFSCPFLITRSKAGMSNWWPGSILWWPVKLFKTNCGYGQNVTGKE